MDLIKEKIGTMAKKLEILSLLDKKEIDFEYTECHEYKKTNTPPGPDAPWKTFEKGMRFSGVDTHYWVHFKLEPLMPVKGAEHRLSIKTGREGQWDATNPQGTVFIDGKTVQALDINHTWVPLEDGRECDVYIYVYTGMDGGCFDCEVYVDTVDLRIESLYFDINVPYLCMLELDEKSYDYIKIRDALDKGLIRLDLREVYSQEFYESIEAAAEYLKTEFYEKLCGKSEGVISCIGHTHIDVAWLWTVAQTREKAQRSFSTVINMMKRYEDYIFMSSQPQLYQYVKESDPGLYEEIKQRIKEGRWEPEGAMWLEADTNLISGESLVRQILYGKRFMREEFGVDNKILWLPDVFGYSGALPQILKKSGVTRFFTAKIEWNETDSMPDDNFIWEGIDGSRVFASLIPGYVNILNPSNAAKFWAKYKNKSYSDTALMTFGYGDGGGGPTYEMLETHKRMKYGIPGMPKTTIEKAGDYFDRVEESFEQNAKELVCEPRWIGEIYFERHRGTYTTMAKNKKNNRKSELLYLEAEALSVAGMVLWGKEYPEDTLRKNQTNILLNHFHDIIPGSSIKNVYDVTDKEYEVILREGRKIADENLSVIKSNLKTKGGIFVYNPTPFEISDFVETEGKTYFAGNIPAHGWRVIEDSSADNGVFVSDKLLENDVIRVEFNDKYHLVSVYDKEQQRQVLSEGAEANRIEIFEDYPSSYDAWEISGYYKQKMWIADDVASVEKLDRGLRIKRKYKNSEIVQDIVLREGSKRIDFITTVDWHEDHVLMKAAFPVDVRCSYATYDIQFGNLQRPTHRNTSWDAAKFEVCAHKWADLSENGYGVSILNDCKYGYSIEDNVMKISLLKSATWPNPEADRGINKFTYSLYPHKGGYEEGGTVKEAYLLNMPLEPEKVAAANGSISDCWSLASSNKENVVVETVKKAEEGNSVIVRAYEAYNRKEKAEITVGFDFKEVYICDLMENNIEKLAANGRSVSIKLKNYEIVTLKFII